MNRVELPHDKGRFGPLRAAVDGQPKLVRLVALIERFASEQVADCSRIDAARTVLGRYTVDELFKLSPDGYAQPVTDADRFNIEHPAGYEESGFVIALEQFVNITPAEEAKNFRSGVAGAMAAMLRHWGSPGNAARSLDDDQCAPLAIRLALAAELFPEVFGKAQEVQAPALVPDASSAKPVLQPVGGAWPHHEGAPWTEAERAALFEMRHRLKFSGDELGNIAGVSRQRVDELIGPAKPHGGLAKIVAKDGSWTPPADLLTRCRAPLQPLQAVSAALDVA